MISFLDLIILACATARVSMLIAQEKGPWDIFWRVRMWSRPGIRAGLECVYCVSGYVALALASLYFFLPPYGAWVVDWLAVWGLGLMLWRYSGVSFHD